MQTLPSTFPVRNPLLFAATALLCSALAADAAEYKFDFSSPSLDETLPGFSNGVTGEGHPGVWKIVLADFPSEMALGANSTVVSRRKVLAQTSEEEADNHFPILIYDGEVYDQFKFETRLKTVSGKVEQMAGIAFRIQDDKNYFVLRLSSLGTNVAFYPVKNGKIHSTPIGRKVELKPGLWHALGVECDGNRILCKFDGEQIFDLKDATFAKGKVGFWTKSDAVSYFADASINYVPRERFATVLVRDMKAKYPRVLGLKLSAYSAPNRQAFQVVASLDPAEAGKAGDPLEKEVLAHSTVYYGKTREKVSVALPLHDRNGEVTASLRVTMKSFPGQTEINAIARAMPIAKDMEARLLGGRDLME